MRNVVVALAFGAVACGLIVYTLSDARVLGSGIVIMGIVIAGLMVKSGG